MKSSDDPKVIAVRQAAVAQQTVRRHEPGQERSKKDLKDRARAAARRAKSLGAYVNPAKLREAVETSVIDTYLTFADAVLEGSMGQKRLQRKFKSKKVTNKAGIVRKFAEKVKQGKQRDFEGAGEGVPAEYDNALDTRGVMRMLGMRRGAKHQYRSDNYEPNYKELKQRQSERESK